MLLGEHFDFIVVDTCWTFDYILWNSRDEARNRENEKVMSRGIDPPGVLQDT